MERAAEAGASALLLVSPLQVWLTVSRGGREKGTQQSSTEEGGRGCEVCALLAFAPVWLLLERMLTERLAAF